MTCLRRVIPFVILYCTSKVGTRRSNVVADTVAGCVGNRMWPVYCTCGNIVVTRTKQGIGSWVRRYGE